MRLRHGESVERMDAVRRTKDGRTIHAWLTFSPVIDERGQVVGAAKVVRDITEARSRERQLQQSQKMDAVSQLTGGVAHDFNNLLAIITGALELQEPHVATNVQALEAWGLAHAAALRGADLTRRLMAFSSQEQLSPEPIGLPKLLGRLLSTARNLVSAEVTLELKIDEAVPEVMANASGLEMALLNLIVNARDAMPNGGRLSMSTSLRGVDASCASQLGTEMAAGTYACVSVSDNGVGMPPEVLDRAFEPFFTTRERGRGTGLGLSMVYGFAKQSQGGVRLYSEVGQGTTVLLYLPLADLAATPAEEPRRVAAPSHLGGSVLVVDDESGLVKIAVTYLRKLGYRTHSAKDADEALMLLKSGIEVDVMVTDVIMGGGMDGMELAREVHRLRPEIRVIYSSGFSADALSGRRLSVPNSLVLQKPYRLAELGEIVERAWATA